MKLCAFLSFLMAGVLISGCAARKQNVPVPAPHAPAIIVTPDNSIAGKVFSYNDAGRFVVLSFPVGQMPRLGQDLFLYRGGLKTGEVRVTGPQQDNNIIADVVSGNAQAGDEVRDQ